MNEGSDPSRRPRALLLAYSCGPMQGSEPGVGWNRALQTARYCDTWLLCSEKWAECVRRFCDEHGEVPGLRVIGVPDGRIGTMLRRVKGLGYLRYNLWHRCAYQVARQLHDELNFDFVHMVNFCGFREPGYLWRLDAPFVWGPVGGAQYYPVKFLREAGWRGAGFEVLRSAATWWQMRFSWRVRQATRNADVLLVANSTNQHHFREVHRTDAVLLLETGVTAENIRRREPPQEEGKKLRILWVGNLEPWKAPTLMLKAVARLPGDVPYELRMMGDGRLRGSCEKLARQLGVARHATWLGWLSDRREVQEQFAWADVFVFTSLRDTSGNVVLEAFAAGVPVVCMDHHGARDMVTAACGIKIPVTNREEVIDGLAQALVRLANDRGLRERLAEGARRRAEEYLWDRQGHRMAAIYQRLLPEGLCWLPRDRASGTPGIDGARSHLEVAS